MVGRATTGQAALDLMADAKPDVAVIDISMPDMSGIELARRAALQCPAVRLVALTMHEDQAYVRQILSAGARGYLLKRPAAEELVRAVRAVMAGGCAWTRPSRPRPWPAPPPRATTTHGRF